MKKLIVVALLMVAFSGTALAGDCQSSDECMNDKAITGLGKINNTLRAVYYELKETNKLLKEGDKNNGITGR